MPKIGFFVKKQRQEKQSGNVLFLILIAVALFAGLSYVVTKTTRGGGDPGREKIALNAARITQYVVQLRQAALRLQATNGCSDTQLDFSGYIPRNGPWPFALPPVNPNRRADGSCDIFNSSGGSVPVISFDKEFCVPGHEDKCGFSFYNGSVQNIGTSRTEVLLWGYYIDHRICQELNRSFGVQYDMTPISYGGFTDYYDDIGSGVVIGGGGGVEDVFSGQADGCYCYNTEECNPYFTIVVR